MPVSINLIVRGGTNNSQGFITADVTAANHGNENLVGSVGAFGFWLTDAAGNYVPGFRRDDHHVSDAQSLPPGGACHRQIHFSVPNVMIGQTYSLICLFQQTRDQATEIFQFQQLYLGTN